MRNFHLVDAAGVALIFCCLAITAWIVVLVVEQFGWQSSAAMLISGAGVVAGIWTVVWQQSQITRRETEARRSKNLAARAVMPPALSAITRYAKESAGCILSIYGPDETVLAVVPAPELPAIPYDSLTVLKECVEFADDADGRLIASCVRLIQIQNARLAGFLEKYAESAVSPYDCLTILADTIELHAFCGSLFEYARMSVDSIPPDEWKRDVLSSCWQCGAFEGDYDALLAALRGRHNLEGD